ncbi:MAG TPA: alpha/beta fold hydrolase [Thermoplasmata archaeon]|nr:alpha/beta fold hydrolase [Thermoplasmata archaeon]
MTGQDLTSPLIFLDLGGDAKAPTALLLHGLGADEHDLAPLGNDLRNRFRVHSLRAPLPYIVGAAWYDLPGQASGATGIGPEPETFKRSIEIFDAHVKWLRKRSPSSKFLFVGFSQGALMSLSFATQRPECVLGIVALSGYLPKGDLLPGPISNLRDLPIFIAHGSADDLLPIQLGRDARARCEKAGAKLTYTEHRQGHTIPRETWAAALEFISKL